MQHYTFCTCIYLKSFNYIFKRQKRFLNIRAFFLQQFEMENMGESSLFPTKTDIRANKTSFWSSILNKEIRNFLSLNDEEKTNNESKQFCTPIQYFTLNYSRRGSTYCFINVFFCSVTCIKYWCLYIFFDNFLSE